MAEHQVNYITAFLFLPTVINAILNSPEIHILIAHAIS